MRQHRYRPAAGVLISRFVYVNVNAQTTSCCSYEVTGLTGKDVAFLQSKGWEAGLIDGGNNSGYICEPCLAGSVGCADSPTIPQGLPDPLLYDGSYSSECGPCQDPGAI